MEKGEKEKDREAALCRKDREWEVVPDISKRPSELREPLFSIDRSARSVPEDCMLTTSSTFSISTENGVRRIAQCEMLQAPGYPTQCDE